ncbi:MAG: hypothetical protein LC098_06380 [Burkholderiales bacterium]|nr:hypothetical protein [Pseudomonadota bacterium]MCZ2135037.1 hypothetical protein [Burkholderiales bacterium]
MVIPSHPTTHDGLDRLVGGTVAARSLLRAALSPKQLPLYVLGAAVMAVVTATERALDAIGTGFALEWLILTAVALLSFGLLANVIVGGTRSVQAHFAARAERRAALHADRELWQLALTDPRVMHDLQIAEERARDPWLDNEAAMRVSMSVRDDGLAAVAPWPQATRYY